MNEFPVPIVLAVEDRWRCDLEGLELGLVVKGGLLACLGLVQEAPHKDRSTRQRVCACACAHACVFPVSHICTADYSMLDGDINP